MSVLEVSDVSIRFGGLAALAGLSITVNEFEIVGLIGPNGAGKTTAFNCITGFYKADTGSVTYRGRDVTRMPPHKKAAIGFGRTFQNVGMVKSATALENLKTAQHVHAGYSTGAGVLGLGQARNREAALTERAEQILDMLKLSDIRDRRVGGLPYGVLKLLEVGCALATDPDVLLLDEPSSGMGPEEAHELGDRLLNLRRELGLTMLLIEHHVPLVTAVCDYVYVLNFGRLLAEGEPSLIRTHPEVVAAYLGGEAPGALEETTETPEDAELESQLAAEVAHVSPVSAGATAPRARSPRAGLSPLAPGLDAPPTPGSRRARVRPAAAGDIEVATAFSASSAEVDLTTELPASSAAAGDVEVATAFPASSAQETAEFPALAVEGEPVEETVVVVRARRSTSAALAGKPARAVRKVSGTTTREPAAASDSKPSAPAPVGSAVGGATRPKPKPIPKPLPSGTRATTATPVVSAGSRRAAAPVASKGQGRPVVTPTVSRKKP